jgi:hypothetical protein
MSVSVMVHNTKVSERLLLFPTFDRITQSLDIPYSCTKSSLLFVVFSITVHKFMVYVNVKCFHMGFKPLPTID